MQEWPVGIVDVHTDVLKGSVDPTVSVGACWLRLSADVCVWAGSNELRL